MRVVHWELGLRFTTRIRFSTAVQVVEDLNQKVVDTTIDPRIFTRLLKTCLKKFKQVYAYQVFDKVPRQVTQSANKSKIIHAQTLKFGIASLSDPGNAIVDLYAKCGNFYYARNALDRLDERDGRAWNSIISIYSRSGMGEEVIRGFGLMREANVEPNQFTFAMVLSTCAKMRAGGVGRQVHSCLIKLGFEYVSFCEGSLIDMYAKCGYLADACRVFDGADSFDTVSWTSMIAGYVRVGLPEKALDLFEDMQRVGVTPDQVAYVTVITAYVDLGSLDDALILFNQMADPNVVAWNVMISGHARSGFVIEAVTIFRDMRLAGIRPSRSSLGSVLSAIANLVALDLGQQVHSDAFKLGLDSNVYVRSSLINMYAKCQVMEAARKVFDSLDERNLVLWNAMLAGYALNMFPTEVIEMFLHIRDHDEKPDAFTYTSVLSACACLKSIELGKQLHSSFIKSNLASNLFVGNALVDMYAKCGDMTGARQQFELIPYRDNVSWNAIIVGYVHEENEDEACNMFRRMNFDGYVPDEVSLSSILSGCANTQALQHGKQIHCFLLKYSLDMNVYAGSSLIDMYAKSGKFEAARNVLARMPEHTVVSMNALIAGYVLYDNSEEAINLFREMQAKCAKLTKFTFASILAVLSGSSRVSMGKQVHCHTLKSGDLHDDVFLGVSLIGIYLKSLNNEDAGKLFLEFPNHRTIILWTAMISGYAQNGYFAEALSMFRDMRKDGIWPDQSAFACVLSACAGLAALKDGTEVHCLIVQTGFNLDENTCSALIDMYAKCGDIRSSSQVFEEMDFKQEVISWNSMIVGLAKNGYAEDALRIFHQMEDSNVKPDDITFLGVLTACSHAGMVSEGRGFFDSMINYYGIQPRMDHYACMIDLFGRRGLLKEAEKFINDFSFEPDSKVWATLLAACKVHGDDVLGKWAAEKLIELEPYDSSPYILLSNIYAASKNWDGVNAVRKLMKEKGVMKSPGCSWIVIGTKTHLFIAGDKFHPSADEICGVLKDLTALMKEDGYVAVINCMLDEEDFIEV
ncbi:hypothetical protein Scep_014752 [Stephania cephalantha]|uniref:Pentatricopeptide repeat-containing protein n=1 Tax=Stephania cephalantha TaxID=152367 RepID=A0AAP0P3B6_9MAGN